MFDYRLTALLVPAFLLLALPALAAHPWQLPLGNGLTIPFLTLLTILYCALRYPGLLSSPMVFCSGLACDLFTRTPVGFWALLFLITLACARSINDIVERRGPLLGYLCFSMAIALMCAMSWALTSLYQLQMHHPYKHIEAMMMALVLLPLPITLLIGFENLMILKQERQGSHFTDVRNNR